MRWETCVEVEEPSVFRVGCEGWRRGAGRLGLLYSDTWRLEYAGAAGESKAARVSFCCRRCQEMWRLFLLVTETKSSALFIFTIVTLCCSCILNVLLHLICMFCSCALLFLLFQNSMIMSVLKHPEGICYFQLNGDIQLGIPMAGQEIRGALTGSVCSEQTENELFPVPSPQRCDHYSSVQYMQQMYDERDGKSTCVPV